jgi:hypothetical protein
MPRSVRCPKRKTILTVPDEAAGKKIACSGCKAVLAIPARPPAPNVATAPAPKRSVATSPDPVPMVVPTRTAKAAPPLSIRGKAPLRGEEDQRDSDARDEPPPRRKPSAVGRSEGPAARKVWQTVSLGLLFVSIGTLVWIIGSAVCFFIAAYQYRGLFSNDASKVGTSLLALESQETSTRICWIILLTLPPLLFAIGRFQPARVPAKGKVPGRTLSILSGAGSVLQTVLGILAIVVFATSKQDDLKPAGITALGAMIVWGLSEVLFTIALWAQGRAVLFRKVGLLIAGFWGTVVLAIFANWWLSTKGVNSHSASPLDDQIRDSLKVQMVLYFGFLLVGAVHLLAVWLCRHAIQKRLAVQEAGET